MVDDRIPIISDSRWPLFSRYSAKDESWVTLIEKAYAKLLGHYSKVMVRSYE
jgi:hypothetical protein